MAPQALPKQTLSNFAKNGSKAKTTKIVFNSLDFICVDIILMIKAYEPMYINWYIYTHKYAIRILKYCLKAAWFSMNLKFAVNLFSQFIELEKLTGL